MLQLLSEQGANVSVEGGTYDNALSIASYRGHEEVVRLLQEKGAKIYAESELFGIALSVAPSISEGPQEGGAVVAGHRS